MIDDTLPLLGSWNFCLIFEQNLLWQFQTKFWIFLKKQEKPRPLISSHSKLNTREKLLFKCENENCLSGAAFQNHQIKAPNFQFGGFWACSFRKFMMRRKINLICTCVRFIHLTSKSSSTPPPLGATIVRSTHARNHVICNLTHILLTKWTICGENLIEKYSSDTELQQKHWFLEGVDELLLATVDQIIINITVNRKYWHNSSDT